MTAKKTGVAIALGAIVGGTFWIVAHHDAGGKTTVMAAPSALPATSTTAVQASASPPRFVSTTKAPRLPENDPSSPRYDAHALLNLLGGSIGTLFEAEPRDEKWAPVRESRMNEIFTKDLLATGLDVQVKSLECKSATCKLSMQSENKADLIKAAVLTQYSPIATATEPGQILQKGSTFENSTFFAWDRRGKQNDWWDKWYPKARKVALDELRRDPPLGEVYPPVPSE